MNTATIITATLLRPSVRRICAECNRVLGPTMIRVAWKDGDSVHTAFYCSQIEDNEEVRGCAPDHPLVRAAINRSRLAQPRHPRPTPPAEPTQEPAA